MASSRLTTLMDFTQTANQKKISFFFHSPRVSHASSPTKEPVVSGYDEIVTGENVGNC